MSLTARLTENAPSSILILLRRPSADRHERAIDWRILPAVRGRVVGKSAHDGRVPARCDLAVNGFCLADRPFKLLRFGPRVTRKVGAAVEIRQRRWAPIGIEREIAAGPVSSQRESERALLTRLKLRPAPRDDRRQPRLRRQRSEVLGGLGGWL